MSVRFSLSEMNGIIMSVRFSLLRDGHYYVHSVQFEPNGCNYYVRSTVCLGVVLPCSRFSSSRGGIIMSPRFKL